MFRTPKKEFKPLSRAKLKRVVRTLVAKEFDAGLGRFKSKAIEKVTNKIVAAEQVRFQSW